MGSPSSWRFRGVLSPECRISSPSFSRPRSAFSRVRRPFALPPPERWLSPLAAPHCGECSWHDHDRLLSVALVATLDALHHPGDGASNQVWWVRRAWRDVVRACREGPGRFAPWVSPGLAPWITRPADAPLPLNMLGEPDPLSVHGLQSFVCDLSEATAWASAAVPGMLLHFRKRWTPLVLVFSAPLLIPAAIGPLLVTGSHGVADLAEEDQP